MTIQSVSDADIRTFRIISSAWVGYRQGHFGIGLSLLTVPSGSLPLCDWFKALQVVLEHDNGVVLAPCKVIHIHLDGNVILLELRPTFRRLPPCFIPNPDEYNRRAYLPIAHVTLQQGSLRRRLPNRSSRAAFLARPISTSQPP